MDLTSLTVIVVRVTLVVTMLSIGLRVASRPASGWPAGRLVTRTALANLVIVPAAAVALVRALALPDPVAVGLLAVGAAPAGALGPKLAQLARGDLRVAVLATFALSLLAPLTVPPTLAIGARLAGVDVAAAPVDAVVVVTALASFQLLPMIVGLAVAASRPGAATRLAGPTARLSTALVVIVIALALADTADELVRLGPAAPLGMLALAGIAAAAGGRAGSPEGGARRSLAVVTAQRSSALALMVVAGPGHAVETATVTAAALLLLLVNVSLATVFGRAPVGATPHSVEPFARAHRESAWTSTGAVDFTRTE